MVHLIPLVAAVLNAAVADAHTAHNSHDGRREIEERNAGDTRTAYHVNGAQFIDERAATYSDVSGQFRYYLLGDNFSIVGYGNAAGGVTRVRSGSVGDFVCDPPPPPCNGCGHAPTCPGDVDGDGSVGAADLALFLGAFGSTLGDPTYDGCADFDCDDTVGLADMGELLGAFGEPCPPDVASGAFVLHGRPVDVLGQAWNVTQLSFFFNYL